MSDTIELIDSEAARLASASEPSPSGAWSDWLGMVASIGCAVHCAAMPFVIAYLPALGLSFLADEAFHKWMAAACFVIALMAFIPGFRKHRRLTPVFVASVGLVMISVAAFGFAGKCCPSCDADAATASSVGRVASATPVSLEGEDALGDAVVVEGPEIEQDSEASETADVCTDADCPHCAASGSSADALTALNASSAPSPWVGLIVPWLTPLGGIVLVSAHLLNRRYGCLCGCCDSSPSEGAAV